MTEAQKPDLSPKPSHLRVAGALFAEQAEWTAQEQGTRLGRIDAVSDIGDMLPGLLREQAETIGYHPSDRRVDDTVAFLGRMLWTSPLPPINIREVTRQIVTSQASKGEIPLALQEIACLNYMLVTRPVPYGERYDLEILPVSNDQPKKRWRKFLDEERDFLLGLTEIGVRPVVAFGVSDVLDFEKEEDFSHTNEELQSAINQNRQTMIDGMTRLNASFETIRLPDISLRPAIQTFLHSELLQGKHGEVFADNTDALSKRPGDLNAFREWLFTTFPRVYERSRRDPDHVSRLTKMLALYATDNELASQLLQSLFPNDQIESVISVSLQPPQVWEWIEEKTGCEMLGVPIAQISPFPNAGNWHGKAEETAYSSLRALHGLQNISPKAAFTRLMREADLSILPEIHPNQMRGDEIMQQKRDEVRALLTTIFGAVRTADAERVYNQRKQHVVT